MELQSKKTCRSTNSNDNGHLTISTFSMDQNVILISVSFFLLLNSFNSLQSLQSCLHREEGLGAITTSTIYGSLFVSSVFLPNVTIAYLGPKWTLLLSVPLHFLDGNGVSEVAKWSNIYLISRYHC